MALQWADRVKETTTTSGTGTITLGGAMTGFRTFGSVMANGDTCYYALQSVDASGAPTGAWEVGSGTYSSGTLARSLLASSTGSLISLTGVTQVWLDLPAAAIMAFLTSAPGRLLNVRVLSGSGTYTPTTGATRGIVELVGGGGAGAGAVATTSGQGSAGGPGGGGGYVRHYYASLASVSYSVGAGGTGNLGADGGAGGNTTFGTLLGNGGAGGTSSVAASVATGGFTGAGGLASGGNLINSAGGSSASCIAWAANGLYFTFPGGSSLLGAGGVGGRVGVTAAPGSGFGSGGGGVISVGAASATTGANGAAGTIIVTEFA